jgi:glycosyltransferase involved in cell wall biosynthesis
LKPNVLHIIDSFEQGGTERQAVQLVRLLHESNRYGVHLACIHDQGMLRAEVEQLGIGEITAYPLNSFFNRNFVRQLRRLRSFLREREIDIVHTHGLYTNVFGIIGAAFARVPVRIASRRETGGLRNGIRRWGERRAFHLSNAIIANAEAVRRDLIAEGVTPEKVLTVYNGLDVERVAPQAARSREEALAVLGLPQEDERRFITIVANVRHPVKDHPMFLRASRRVREQIPQAAFVIAGEGELLESLQELARELGIERDVFFTGRCERVAELLALSEVCVLSSKAEGFSNAILEYMAAARAVVATDVGGAREAIVEGETGYLVPSGDDALMSERIISLLNNPERTREMGERGRRLVKEKFSCEAQLERTEKLYDELLIKVAPRWARNIETIGSEGASHRGSPL